MLPTFVIGLREGVEAALIVGIVAAFLRQEGRRDAMRWMWLGVGLAIAICLAVGVALRIVNHELPQREQEGLETIIGALAVCAVTFMVVWMRRNARGLAGELRENAAAALAKGSTGALIGMAFFAVIREGFETVVFLLAAFDSATNPTTAGFGALLGILVAVAIGAGIYRGGVRLNLAKFFRVTGFILVLVAAGLVANAFHTAHEAGWLASGQDQALDLSWLVVPGTWTASLLTGMLGLQPRPAVIELVGYLVYAVPMLLYVAWPDRWRRRLGSRAVRGAATASLLLVAALVLVSCGDSGNSGGAGGGKKVAIKLTDAGCEPQSISLAAGPTTFEVTNAGTDKVSEFEVLDGQRVLGEKENLVSGLSGRFSLTLQPGEYRLWCPGGETAEHGTLKVGGAQVAATKDAKLDQATTAYHDYAYEQAEDLVARTHRFAAAVRAGDVEKAKGLFAPTRAPYERIEPVAESFGTLDPKIDARVNDVAEGAAWTGFHRIEKALWVDGSTRGMAKVADQLVRDVEALEERVKDVTFTPEELANGATSLLDEVSATKLTGEEDRYSHTDLSDVEANVAGSQKAFGLLAPALRERDARLAASVNRRFAAVDSALLDLRSGGGFPSYEKVSKATRRHLSQLVDALAEPLSHVAATLQRPAGGALKD